MNDSVCWAGPLTPAERRMLAGMLGRAARACAFTGHDGTYSLSRVIAAAECRALADALKAAA